MATMSLATSINAVPLRHPWRWVAAIVIVIVVGLFLYGAATNQAYGWSVHRKYILDERIAGRVEHIQLTIWSMMLGSWWA